MKMDPYGETCHHKEISCIKIVKYLLMCTLALLLIGLVTLAVRLSIALMRLRYDDTTALETFPSWMSLSRTQIERSLIHLLLDYGTVFLVTLIALVAALKENFFFLLTSALANLTLMFVNLFVAPYRWSIIFLQLASSLFTIAYTLSVYVRMKIDIRRKKRLARMDHIRGHFGDHRRRPMSYGFADRIAAYDENCYRTTTTGSEKSHSYDRLVLTGEWLAAHQPPQSSSSPIGSTASDITSSSSSKSNSSSRRSEQSDRHRQFQQSPPPPPPQHR